MSGRIDFAGGEPLNIGVETPTRNCPNCPIGELVVTAAPSNDREGYVEWKCESIAGGCGYSVRAPRFRDSQPALPTQLMGRPF